MTKNISIISWILWRHNNCILLRVYVIVKYCTAINMSKQSTTHTFMFWYYCLVILRLTWLRHRGTVSRTLLMEYMTAYLITFISGLFFAYSGLIVGRFIKLSLLFVLHLKLWLEQFIKILYIYVAIRLGKFIYSCGFLLKVIKFFYHYIVTAIFVFHLQTYNNYVNRSCVIMNKYKYSKFWIRYIKTI